MLTIGRIGIGITDSIPDSGPLLTAIHTKTRNPIPDSGFGFIGFLPESELGIATATQNIYQFIILYSTVLNVSLRKMTSTMIPLMSSFCIIKESLQL